MAIDTTVPYTITAPAAVDGYGAIAVLNDPNSANFVGYLLDSSGFDGPEVRETADVVVEGDGGVHGNFKHGRRPFTLDIVLAPAATWALSNARLDKLLRATNAMTADGTVVWTETGSVAKRLNFRRQQPPRLNDRRVLFAGVSADARILQDAEQQATGTAGGVPVDNVGNAGTFPKFVLTSPTNTIVLTNDTTGAVMTLTGLSGAGTVTVDFAARTVRATNAPSNRDGAITWPSSEWWELQPAVNTVKVSGATATNGVKWRSAWI